MGNGADTKAGLLGKVAKFIKNPAADWASLGRDGAPHSQSASDAGSSRLALKDMIENKRRNDAVRKREFDMLRQLRRKGKGLGSALDMADISSSYASSQSPRDTEISGDGGPKRERTLRKIDEIEAQLSHSWFRKPGEPSTVPMGLRATQPRRPVTRAMPMTLPPAMAQAPNPGHIPASDFIPAALPSGAGSLGQPRSSGRLPPELAFGASAPASLPEPPVLTQTYQPARPVPRHGAPDHPLVQARLDLELPELAAQPGGRASEPRPLHPPAPAAHRRASVYENALEGQLEVVTLRQDPEIEEAAISLAGGDESAAESTLLKLISAGCGRRQDVAVWLTLFDLYRVTGKAEAFNDLALEFITLFGRSAPQWERAPGAALASKHHAALQAVARAGTFTWACPAQFNARALAALIVAVNRGAPPWRIDWRAIKAMEPDVPQPLNGLLTQWADTPTPLQFLGGEQLLAVLAGQTPAGDKNVNPVWWRVRLSLLRLMNAPDLFDQAALDYCITYEVSPPAWAPPKGSYTPLRADGQPETAPAEAAPSAPLPIFEPTAIPVDLLVTTGVFETVLEGEILGSAEPVLAALPPYPEHIRGFEFNCRALRRVDFGAAGELLNWSIKQQGQGRTVIFRDVHRLLAAFFSVIGINAAAQVVLRKD